MIGAFVSGIACALGVGYLKENSRIKEDTAMGIVFSGMFAIGLVLFTKIQTSQHLTHILFGNVLGVSRQELIQTAIIALIIFILLGLKRRDFLLYCFDPSHALSLIHISYLPNPYPFKINVLAVYLIVSVSSVIVFFSLWQFYKSKANINPIH